MDLYTSILVICIISVSGAVFSWMARVKEHGRLWPLLEEERRLKLQFELRRQREADEAKEQATVQQDRIKELTTRVTHMDQQLTSRQKELDETRAAVDAAEEETLTARQHAREQELQLHAAQTRVTDLEGTVAAERGRLAALQAALDAKSELVQQLTNELTTTNNTLATERIGAQQRELGLRNELAEHEKNLAGGSSEAELMKAEVDKTRAAHAALEQDNEARTADWNRRLNAADQKYQLLQKEYMSLVNAGGHGDAAAAVVDAEEKTRQQDRLRAAETRAQELEEQLSQNDAATRKKLRESEYRICELEAKLAEAEEAKTAAVADALGDLPPAPPTMEQPRPEYLAKLHEELAATKEICLELTQEKEKEEPRPATQALVPEVEMPVAAPVEAAAQA